MTMMAMTPFTRPDIVSGMTLKAHITNPPADLGYLSSDDYHLEIDGELQEGLGGVYCLPDSDESFGYYSCRFNLVPINDVHYLPRFENTLPEAPIKICQAPTRKFNKHTDVFNRVMARLQADHQDIEQVILERIPHIQCLKLKRGCHIVFDHMRGWFGISSLESLCQGKPVIAGLDDWNVKCIKKFTGANELPWLIARNEKELQNVLLRLLSGPELRLTSGKQARNFMEQYWTEQRVLQVLFKVYETI